MLKATDVTWRSHLDRLLNDPDFRAVLRAMEREYLLLLRELLDKREPITQQSMEYTRGQASLLRCILMCAYNGKPWQTTAEN